jgi:hypothetical protein
MLSTREATIPPAELFTPTYLNSSIATFFKEHFSTPPSPPIATPFEPSISKPQELSTFPPTRSLHATTPVSHAMALPE